MQVVDDDAPSWPDGLSGASRYAHELGLRPLGLALVAALGAALVVVNPGSWAGPALLGLALAIVLAIALAVVVRTAGRPVQANLDGNVMGTFLVPRGIVVLGIALTAEPSATLFIGLSLTAFALIGELPTRILLRRAFPYAANFPSPTVRNWPRINPSFPVAFSAVALAVTLVAAVQPGIRVSAILLALGVGISVGVVALDAALRTKARRSFDEALPHTLTELAPEFVLHWDAPQGTVYQVQMWLPFLERSGLPFFVILRDETNLREVAAVTTAPIVVCPSLELVERAVVPSLRAALYVNTATSNAHLVRYTELTHVQLNHGDSDKTPSYNPVFRMYDKNFVAGQAAIDRFAANGIKTPEDFFTIVGRPQVEGLDVASDALSTRTEGGHTVLYAPTWLGFHSDARYSSLAEGESIVRALLDSGCTVIFRPHPYSNRTRALRDAIGRIDAVLREDSTESGRSHVFGHAANSDRTLVDCMNDSDALVSDVSSVVGDFLFTEKPYSVVSVTDQTNQFERDFPVARGGYTIELSNFASSMDSALTMMLVGDPKREDRRELKRYYLGDFPPTDYASHFLDALRRVVQ